MLVRDARTSDLSRIAQITTTSLRDDPTYDYQWENRHAFPDDNLYFWHVHLKKMLYDPRTRFFVVELEEHDEPGLVEEYEEGVQDEEKGASASAPPLSRGYVMEGCEQVQGRHIHQPRTVIAYGIWERVGRSWAAWRWIMEKNTLINRLDALNASLERRLLARKALRRRDGSDSREAALREASETVRRECFHARGLREWWSMELVVTDRPYRRRGAARRLVDIGCRWADHEGVWAGVEASPMGELVYGSMGFVKVADKTVKVEGEEEELTFAVMLREPKAEGKE